MFDIDRLKEILDTLSRNRSRTFLTGFGIFWGIFMLLAMQGGGAGLQTILRQNFDGFATNSIILAANHTSKPYRGFKRGRTWNLHTDDVAFLKSAVAEADVICPMISFWGKTAVCDGNKSTVCLKGETADYTSIETPEIRYGRALSEMDIVQHRKVCVLGKRVYQELFPKGGNPAGRFIQIGGSYYEVVGVDFNTSNMSINGPSDESVVIPINVLQTAFHTGSTIHLMAMTAKPGVSSTILQEKVREALYRKYYIAPEDRQAMFLVNTEKMFSMVDNLYTGLNILIWLVGLGTLLAGAIGVSNIMMVTVKERTTEIGIRRAIGATPRMILGQIMSESIILTISAGALGIMFSVLLLSGADTVAAAMGMTNADFQVSFWTAVSGLAILTVLGLLAGLAPAARAMSIKPVDAMRDE